MASIALSKERLDRYKKAGYTHYIEYEAWLPIADTWGLTGFPTTADAVESHRATCERRIAKGEIRQVNIILLV